MKPRRTVNGLTVHEELELWRTMFTTGADYFHALAPLGIPPFQDDHDAARTAAASAWQRLGALFLASWWPVPGGRKQPWALETFGPPPD